MAISVTLHTSHLDMSPLNLKARQNMPLMSKTLDIRGTTTIIDHGIGIFTGYWHQQESAVSVGQKLASGDLIGYVGNTGLSTGPHLHWEVWINGNQVNPLEWMKQDIY